VSVPFAVPFVADAWYDELAVSQPGDDARGYPLRLLLGGLGVALGPVCDIVRDSDDGPGYSALLSPTRAPVWALPWLAQWAGVNIVGVSEAEARARINRPPAFERGTPPAMIAAAQATLSGTKQVRLVERAGGDAYHLTAVTRTSETLDAAATLRAFMSQKPAGLIFVHVVASEPIWDEATKAWDVVGSSVSWDSVVVGDV
jgi:Phage tail protein (Tail_P2_I)